MLTSPFLHATNNHRRSRCRRHKPAPPAFAHAAAGCVYDLPVAGEAEPLGVTALHPVWSLDRNDWVPAGELVLGENVKFRRAGSPSTGTLRD
ncbi:MAG: hypothetical protein CMJ48_08900 [Planctomycetaceae bacterium]|nr:hypothetical protein [Planctomycetaceae bacterium]